MKEMETGMATEMSEKQKHARVSIRFKREFD
jgi:hypothetical protein